MVCRSADESHRSLSECNTCRCRTIGDAVVSIRLEDQYDMDCGC